MRTSARRQRAGDRAYGGGWRMGVATAEQGCGETGLHCSSSPTLACLPWSRKTGQSKVHPAGNGASRTLLGTCWHISPGPEDLALGTGRGGPGVSIPADWSCQLQSHKSCPGPGWQSINMKDFIALYNLPVLYSDSR